MPGPHKPSDLKRFVAFGSSVGIEIIPLWRVSLERDRSLSVEKLADDDSTKPAF